MQEITQEENIRIENVNFSESQPSWVAGIKSEPDSTFSQTDTTDSDLGNFLSRPMKYATIQWNVGSGLDFQFDPWKRFFEDPKIINRVAHFHMVRAKLHVKFVMTGSTFYYGRGLASYQPLPVFDETEEFMTNNFRYGNLTNYSQRQSVFLDPCGSAGGTLELSFVHPANNVLVSISEWQTLGRIRVDSFTPLKHINGGTAPVEISIFMWATDVHLSMLTTVKPSALVPQMGILDSWRNDEYNGMVSGPAAIVEHMAGRLKQAPIIGPYAMATQTLAGKVGSIARFFGFSRPTIPESPAPYVYGSYGNMTNTNVHDLATKLTLDAKQETTIDTRVTGLHGEDELTIPSIASREAFLTSFVWTTTTSADSILWSASNVPTHFQTEDFVSIQARQFHLTPMCFAALPFHYWRGSINYRFVVVGTPNHKGKIAVKFDPSRFVSSEYHVVYNHVLDLEKDRDFTIKVGWAQSLNYLEVPTLDNSSQPFYGQDRRSFLPNANGVIELTVQNRLTCVSATANSDVTVLVFVSAGDDFELIGPDDTSIERLTYFPQMGTEDTDAGRGDGHPLKSESWYTFGQIGGNPANCAIHDGDPVVSFRTMLKRYYLSRVIPMDINNFNAFRITQSDFPFYKGLSYNVNVSTPQKNGIHWVGLGTPLVATKYNIVNTTLLNYLTPAFVCRRGGLRRLFVLPNTVNGSYSNYATVSREVRNKPFSQVIYGLPATNSALGAANSISEHLYRLAPSMWKGATRADPEKAGCVHVELPYHNNRRFYTAKRLNMTSIPEGFQSHSFNGYLRTDADSRAVIYDYVSTAEDFNLSYYTGPPPVYFPTRLEPIPPP